MLATLLGVSVAAECDHGVPLAATHARRDVREAIVAKAGLSGRDDAKLILSGMRWLGLFSTDRLERKGTLIDTLAHAMVQKMAYKDGERDMIMLQHTFVLEKPDGTQARPKTHPRLRDQAQETRTSTLLEFGIPNGDTAMSRTVGIPCAIATQLILDGLPCMPVPGAVTTRQEPSPARACWRRSQPTCTSRSLSCSRRRAWAARRRLSPTSAACGSGHGHAIE